MERATNMTSLDLLTFVLCSSLASGMHMKPPISQAVCDDPSFLIEQQTGWCYMSGLQGPCRPGEIFVASGEGNIGRCK